MVKLCVALSMLVDQAELDDQAAIPEHQLGNPRRQLDAMLTARSPTSAENACVAGLKEWSDGTTGRSNANNAVELYVATRVRRALDSSAQVAGYQPRMLAYHSFLNETHNADLTAASYLSCSARGRY